MVLLILESLGSTELIFILAMALVFFGPRKLPQISRSLGKNLAEFRRASEDFKRTWEKEVNLDEYNITSDSSQLTAPPTENSILNDETTTQPLQPPRIEPASAESSVPRKPVTSASVKSPQPEPLSKTDWL